MSSLSEFQELINDIKDEQLLDVAESLLKDMIEIQNMTEKIEMLEESLSKGDRAAFWWFAMGLDREQIDLATNTVIGRKRFLQDKLDREKLKAEIAARPEGEEPPKKKYKKEADKRPKDPAEEMIAQARAEIPIEDLEGLTDQDILNKILNGEIGLGK